VYSSHLYPYKSSNGSNIIITGTDNGLYVTWNGGKPLTYFAKADAPHVNGTGNYGSADLGIAEEPESDDEALYESEEEEIDDDQPFPSVVQDLEISLGASAVHIAVPVIAAQSTAHPAVKVPELFSQCIVLAVSTTDGYTRAITLPIDPPSAATKRKRRLGVRTCNLTGTSQSSLTRGLAITWTSSAEEENPEPERRTRSRTRSQHFVTSPSAHSLLVGVATSELSGTLNLYRIAIHTNEEKNYILPHDESCFHSSYLNSPPTGISFNTSPLPSPAHSHLLIADARGYLRVYDTCGTGPVTSSVSNEARADTSGEQAACVAILNSSFHIPRDLGSDHPGLAQRKKIMDARWVREGRGILAILEDGGWGVWDIDGSQEFAIRGFIGDAPETVSQAAKTKPKPQLAPMTPNTRRVRQDNLFSAPISQQGTAARGGVCVTSFTTSNGTNDDAITLWFNTNVYSIPSLSQLWARLTSSGRDTGSLYGPGLSRIENIELSNETINNITHLPMRQARQLTSGLGAMNIQRDILITTEHRTIIIASTRPHGPGKDIFAGEPVSPTLRQDREMLERGELDLGGMDRMLDDMTGIERTGPLVPRGKRVGFAAY